MESVKVTVKSDEKASRVELFIRFVWYFICMIVIAIVGMFAYIAIAIQWLHILILGKRHPALAKFVTAWYTQVAQVMFYILLCTDERPPIVPEF